MSENQLARRHTLTPENWGMIEAVADAAYKSRKFGVTQGEAAIKMLFCYENGLPLTAANTGLYIVNGKIAAQSNVIAAQIRAHPNYDYRVKRLDNEACTIAILRRSDDGRFEEVGETTFTMEDAEQANLTENDTYNKYPRNMLFGRALTNAYRWYAPDVFSQPLYTPEELGADVIDAEWSYTSEEAAGPATETAAEPPALEKKETVTLQALVSQHGAEAVMSANGGTIPSSDEDLVKVAENLKAIPDVTGTGEEG